MEERHMPLLQTLVAQLVPQIDLFANRHLTLLAQNECAAVHGHDLKFILAGSNLTGRQFTELAGEVDGLALTRLVSILVEHQRLEVLACLPVDKGNHLNLLVVTGKGEERNARRFNQITHDLKC